MYEDVFWNSQGLVGDSFGGLKLVAHAAGFGRQVLSNSHLIYEPRTKYLTYHLELSTEEFSRLYQLWENVKRTCVSVGGLSLADRLSFAVGI